MLPPRPTTSPRAGRPTRPAALVALAAAVILVAAACVPTAAAPSPTPTLAPTTPPSPNPYTGAAPGSGAGVKIGYISAGDVVPYFKQVSDGIAAQASTAGATLVPCDSNLDGGTLMNCLKQLSDAGVKGIIVFALPGSKTASDICGAIASGVPVVGVEYSLDPCSKVTVVSDDLRAGQIAGKAVGAWAKTQWSCTFDALVGLESTTAQARSDYRIAGFRQGFAEGCPGKDGSFQSGVADTASAATSAMQSFFGGNSGKRILVFGINDDAITGTLQAAASAGRTGDVWVAGQGAFDPAVRAQIRSNPQWLGDSAYFPEKYGTSAVPALLDLIAGKTVPSLLLIEPAWLDKTTIGAVYPG